MDINYRAQRTHRQIGVWITVFVLALIFWGVYMIVTDLQTERPIVKIGSAVFRADVAKTDDQRYRGLSGRSELADDRAMLLVFNDDQHWEIVMRNMRFPIDIIWLNEKKQVVHIESNVQPDAEPYNIYRPKTPARYVLEVAAGQAKKSAIAVGVKAEFTLGGDSE